MKNLLLVLTLLLAAPVLAGPDTRYVVFSKASGKVHAVATSVAYDAANGLVTAGAVRLAGANIGALALATADLGDAKPPRTVPLDFGTPVPWADVTLVAPEDPEDVVTAKALVELLNKRFSGGDQVTEAEVKKAVKDHKKK